MELIAAVLDIFRGIASAVRQCTTGAWPRSSSYALFPRTVMIGVCRIAVKVSVELHCWNESSIVFIKQPYSKYFFQLLRISSGDNSYSALTIHWVSTWGAA